MRKLLRVTPGNPRRGNRPGIWDPLRRNRHALLQKNRERAWGRYAALQTEMAHLAANFLLLLGEPFGATVFAGEWLGSLRSQNLGMKVRSARRDGWFVCPRCGANGDRDYMAALNIGIEWDAEDILRRKQKTQGDQVLKGCWHRD